MPRAYSGDLRGSGDSRCGGRLIGARGGWRSGNRRRPPGLVGGGGPAVRRPNHRRAAAARHWRRRLLALITQQAELTLEEIRERLAERGVQAAVSSSALSLAKSCSIGLRSGE